MRERALGGGSSLKSHNPRYFTELHWREECYLGESLDPKQKREQKGCSVEWSRQKHHDKNKLKIQSQEKQEVIECGV